jgi:hypothetical protein
MAKITNLRVIKAYRFDLDCGHLVHRPYTLGVPKTLTIDCPHCLKAKVLDESEGKDLEEEEPDFIERISEQLLISSRVGTIVFILTAMVLIPIQLSASLSNVTRHDLSFLMGVSFAAGMICFILNKLLLRWMA